MLLLLYLSENSFFVSDKILWSVLYYAILLCFNGQWTYQKKLSGPQTKAEIADNLPA